MVQIHCPPLSINQQISHYQLFNPVVHVISRNRNSLESNWKTKALVHKVYFVHTTPQGIIKVAFTSVIRLPQH